MTIYAWVFYALVFAAAGIAAALVYPMVAGVGRRSMNRVEEYQQAKVTAASKALDDIFMQVQSRRLQLVYGFGPVVAGVVTYLLFNNVSLAAAGVALGFILPDLWVKQTRAIRRNKFRAQLVDALFILSSSLRAGLSLTQAFEVLEGEMSAPASQEFGLMNKSHRLGQTFEEALQGLNNRMGCEEMDLITTAVLLARETGGDLTAIITQLVATIRDKKKLQEKVSTLTLQGRLQAYIMSALPVAFAAFVQAFNPTYFEVFFNSQQGSFLLVLAVGLWLFGMIMLFRMAKVEI